MEIVFCERCGVSIPEHQIAGARQASGGRDLCMSCSGPGLADDGDLRLYFCENCRVSIAVSEVITGQARVEGSGYLCHICSESSAANRVARRVAAERELEDGPEAARVPLPLHDARVPIAMDKAPTVPSGTTPSGGSVPLHFCEGCNASIPVADVSAGRALVRSGRTWCQRCRVRVEHGGEAPSAGVLPALAAALLASMTTAAAFVVWEGGRMKDRATVDRETKDEIAGLRESVRSERANVADDIERVDGRIQAVSGSLLDELDDIRASIEAQTAESRRLRELLDARRPGEPNRLDRIEARLAGIDGSVEASLADLEARFEKRLVDALAEARAAAEEAAERAAFESVAPGSGAPPPPTPPGDGETAMSEQVHRSLELLADKDAGVRFSAAIELGKLGDARAWTRLVEVLNRDDDVFVRRACVRSLGELKAYEAFPALIEALTDSEEYVAKQASSVVREMAGQDFGYKQSQSKSERKRVADRATKWWDENKDRVLGN